MLKAQAFVVNKSNDAALRRLKDLRYKRQSSRPGVGHVAHAAVTTLLRRIKRTSNQPEDLDDVFVPSRRGNFWVGDVGVQKHAKDQDGHDDRFRATIYWSWVESPQGHVAVLVWQFTNQGPRHAPQDFTFGPAQAPARRRAPIPAAAGPSSPYQAPVPSFAPAAADPNPSHEFISRQEFNDLRRLVAGNKTAVTELKGAVQTIQTHLSGYDATMADNNKMLKALTRNMDV